MHPTSPPPSPWLETPPPRRPVVPGQLVPAGLAGQVDDRDPAAVVRRAVEHFSDWHHPLLLRPQTMTYNARSCVAPMHGNEPEPTVPDGVEALLGGEDVYRAAPDLHRAGLAQYERIRGEVRTVHIAWQVARYQLAVGRALQQAVPHLARYVQARAAATAAYDLLRATPGPMWRSATMAMLEARREALQAAQPVAWAASAVDELREQMISGAAFEESPSVEEIARVYGLDITGWPDDAGVGLYDDLEGEYREQDRIIQRASELVPDDTGTGQHRHQEAHTRHDH